MDLSKFATPEGITAIIALMGAVVSTVVAILNAMGKRDWADKAAAAGSALAANQDKVTQLVSATSSIIKGVEAVKQGLTTEEAKQLSAQIKAVTTAAGSEDIVKVLVEAVTKGSGNPHAALDALLAAAKKS